MINNNETNESYVQQVYAIASCEQSDGYLKKWANNWIKEL